MGWTAPRTFVTGEVETAAIFNTHLRDNMLALQPQAATILTVQTTASTAFADLATVGPAVTLATGATVLATVGADMWNTTVNDGAEASFAVSGATTLAANDSYGPSFISPTANAFVQHCGAVLLGGLTPGTNTFTMKYHAIFGGTANFSNRILIVEACF